MWRSQIHGTLESQVLVVEHVMSEYLTLAGLLVVQLILQRVGHHEVDGFVHLHEILVIVVIGVTLYLV